jgi:hypothetical protein
MIALLNNYRDLLRDTFGELSLAEGESLEGLGDHPSEIELQSRWFAGDFGRHFTGSSGQRVEIIQFGFWNRGAGPDFCDVVVEIDGRRLHGAVEIDTDVRDWERHGHALNAAYDGVVLHIFFNTPADERFFTRTSAHREVAQLRLDASTLDPVRVADYAQAIARWGRCSFPLRDLPAEKLDSLLESAARHRLNRKASRLERVAELHGWDEALFQGLAGALGYRRNKLPMTVLAQRLPLKFLSAHRTEAEALLFGVAGFLGTRACDQAALDTREYLRGLWQTWWKHRDEFAAVMPLQWVATGTRPMNHPQRRIAALAAVATHWRRIRHALEAGGDAFAEALENLRHPYWEHHFTLTSARSDTAMALIGSSRQTDILANLAFPYWSRQRDDWWPAFTRLPAALENEKSRRAAIRLLGQRPDAARFTRKPWQQQALIQIYEDFCLRDDSDCSNCVFPTQLSRWG